MKFGLANIARAVRRARPSRGTRSPRSSSPAPTARDPSPRWSTRRCAPPAIAARATPRRTCSDRGTVRHRRRRKSRPTARGGGRARAARPRRRSSRRASSTRRRPSSSAPPRPRLSSSARRSVDIAVLEVGLGGRLDATNIVSPDRRRDHVDRLRSPGAARQHDRVDRRREGRHHQARHSGRLRPAAARGARRDRSGLRGAARAR